MIVDSRLDSERQHLLRKLYPKARRNCLIDNFPKECLLREKLDTRGQAKAYDCGLEIALLALILGGIPIREQEEKDVAREIRLQEEGTDPIDLYNGLLSIGLQCRLLTKHSARSLSATLERNVNRVVYIWLGQQFRYARNVNDVLLGLTGHYMLAAFADKNYFYFADPGYRAGKCRIGRDQLEPFWFDYNSRNFYDRLAIEVPVKLIH